MKARRPSFPQAQTKMPPSIIRINPQRAADKCLSWYWGRVYSSLMEDPTDKWWYIDDRADPKNFWILLAIAQPDIYMNRRGKDAIPIGHLTKAVRYMMKEEYRTQIEELMDEDEGECPRCKTFHCDEDDEFKDRVFWTSNTDGVDVCRACLSKE